LSVWRRLEGDISRPGRNDFPFDLNPLAGVIARLTCECDECSRSGRLSIASSSTVAKNAGD
jgi:hypothetical protein